MKEVSRAVDEIQADLRQAADRLAEFLPGLGLGKLMSELEQHHPDDPESMGTDAVCPSVAWDVHGDLGQAREALREVAEVLQKAADRTPETVRAAWLRRRLAADEPRAALAKVSEGLAELERQGVREPEISDFRGSLAELAAHLRELAADPEAAAEPRADAGADLAEIAA